MSFKTSSLSPEILHIVRDKGTEAPFSHPLQEPQVGSYLCRQCGLALFRGSNQFKSRCGWPSFDEELSNAVKIQLDRDGARDEIVCARCNSHLGHVFKGEGYTAKNLRHCVNGLSLDFVPEQKLLDTEEAIFAAGCFWGVEYYFKQLKGVLKTEVGYSGGNNDHPTYNELCRGNTGHYEVIRVLFDATIISYAKLCQFFFEIHNFTQSDGQGPDHGQQYLSRVFYYDETQKQTTLKVIDDLKQHAYEVATQVLPVSTFWPAEDYHQDYYGKNGDKPYCHRWQKLFT